MAFYRVDIDSNSSGAGTATVGPFSGELRAIRVTYGGTPAATTDVTVSETGGMQRDVLTLTNKIANNTFYPRAQIHDPLGVAVTGLYERYYLNSPLTITLAQGVANTASAVSLMIEVT